MKVLFSEPILLSKINFLSVEPLEVQSSEAVFFSSCCLMALQQLKVISTWMMQKNHSAWAVFRSCSGPELSRDLGISVVSKNHRYILGLIFFVFIFHIQPKC